VFSQSHNLWGSPLGSPNLSLMHLDLGLGDAQRPGERQQTLVTPDGISLVATVFEPMTKARAVALVAPATGVPQRFYRPFAQWLAGQGYAVMTVDYRGMAASRCPVGSTRNASMRDWMLKDLPTALDAVLTRAGQGQRASGTPSRLPVLWVGHSMGGHALALQPRLAEIDAAFCIGSQLPAFHRWPAGHARWGARAFFQAWLPLWVRLTGQLPAWALGGGLSIPGPAALDWSRWGQMDNYFASDPAMQPHWRPAVFKGVVQLWCVSDDWVFGPEPAVHALQQAFAQAPGRAELLRLHPADVGWSKIGHFGAFRRQAADKLWPLMLDRCESAVPALGRQAP
jgi:predicted alpha/beta hydrolase